jgi:uncharacterized membrane protein YidH (DUF202 family)
MQDLFYTSHSTIINLGTIGIFFVLYFILVLIMLTLRVLRRKAQIIRKIYSKLRKNLIFGILAILTLECFIQLLIAAKLAFD